MEINADGNYILSRRISLVSLKEDVERIETLLNKNADHRYFKDNLTREISREEIIQKTANANNFIFELTRQCNFRCKYCCYSGDYLYVRKHEQKFFSYKTITRAIDFIYNLIYSKERTKTRRNILISFYGGEALLEFETLLRAIKYAKSLNKKNLISPRFIVNTNGYLLTPEICKSLVDEDVDIHISLDGPKEEHNKFRVLNNGRDTWNRILENINYLRNSYPDFYEKRINFMATIHPNHDIKKIETFFLRNNHIFNDGNVMLNRVRLDFFADEKTEKEFKKKRTLQSQIKLDKKKWFYLKWKYGMLPTILENATRIMNKSTSFTASCFPGGTRLFLDADGKIQICERMNDGFSIGDVDTGFYYDRIKSIVEMWNKKQIELECWKCEISWFCMFCFAPFGVEGNFYLTTKDCKAHQTQIRDLLKNYIEDMEENYDETVNDACSCISDTLLEL